MYQFFPPFKHNFGAESLFPANLHEFGLSFFSHDINGQFRGYATFLGPAISRPMYFPWVSEELKLEAARFPENQVSWVLKMALDLPFFLGSWWKCSGS